MALRFVVEMKSDLYGLGNFQFAVITASAKLCNKLVGLKVLQRRVESLYILVTVLALKLAVHLSFAGLAVALQAIGGFSVGIEVLDGLILAASLADLCLRS